MGGQSCKKSWGALEILIPRSNLDKGNSVTLIKKGSGIVNLNGMIYYEGNIYNAIDLKTYQSRIICAASRAYACYPTIARMLIMDKSNFFIVGQITEDHIIDFYGVQNKLIERWNGSEPYGVFG